MPFNTTLKNETAILIHQNARQQWKRMSERKYNDWWVIQVETLTRLKSSTQYTLDSVQHHSEVTTVRLSISRISDVENALENLRTDELCCMANECSDESRCRSSLETERGQSMSMSTVVATMLLNSPLSLSRPRCLIWCGHWIRRTH